MIRYKIYMCPNCKKGIRFRMVINNKTFHIEKIMKVDSVEFRTRGKTKRYSLNYKKIIKKKKVVGK